MLIRNVAICGQLHHGKTVFTDLLIEQTHDTPWDPSKQIRYTDSRKDEQQRGVSIKSSPVSLVLQVRLTWDRCVSDAHVTRPWVVRCRALRTRVT
jgi:translation elongation factor EF-G